jgi:Xaa-Pro aminopeptidase
MALFDVKVVATVAVPPALTQALQRIAAAAERQAVALEAVLAKLNEPPEPPEDEAAIQAQIDALTARLNASSDTLEQARPTL